MTLHIFESTYRDLRCVRAIAVINKSAKKGIPSRRQKTWAMKTVAPQFTIEEMKSSIEAEAKRWEQKVLYKIALEKCQSVEEREALQERIKNGQLPELRQEEIPMSPPPDKIMKAHQYLYYVKCKPVWSDLEYDKFCKDNGLSGNGGSDLESSYDKDVVELADSYTPS